MNRIEFLAMVRDVHEHPERTVKFLNAMLGLTGEKAIKSYTLGVPESPGAKS